MEDNKDIFKKLQQFGTEPPDPFFDAIMQQVNNPATDESLPVFESLRNLEMPPPPAAESRIMNAIANLPGEESRRTVKIGIAIAGIAATVALIVLLRLPSANDRLIKGADNKTVTVPATVSKDPDSGKRTVNDNSSAVWDAANGRLPVQKSGRPDPLFRITDNDLLSSMMDCGECDFSAYYSGKKKHLVIDIDEYSSVTISDKMMEFMKKLYSTNNRKKPTAKSRKARRLLNQWKQTDAAWFDNHPGRRAMDAVDLLEFIMNHQR